MARRPDHPAARKRLLKQNKDNAMAFAFPGYLEGFLLPDAAFGEAYDALSPETRSYVKTAIARTAAVCGSPDVLEAARSRTMRQGFALRETVRPADWAIVFFDENYAAPTRLLAALLPAALAGVPEILACRVTSQKGAKPFAPAVLASLELAGQELCAELDGARALTLLKDCHAASARGRAVILGGVETLAPLGVFAQDAGLMIRRHAAATRIAIDVDSLPGEYAEEPHGMLRFAHPDAVFAPVPPRREGGDAAPFAAAFCGESAVEALLGRFPLVLTPGHEACWLWPDIAMDFFREQSRAFVLPGQAAF